MAHLPTWRVTATNKPFKFCGVNYCRPFFFCQARSECKAWGLLFTCLCTRCIYVELLISLDLTIFCLHFQDSLIYVDLWIPFCQIMVPHFARRQNNFRCFSSQEIFNAHFVNGLSIGSKFPLMLLVRVGAGKVWLSYLKAP